MYELIKDEINEFQKGCERGSASIERRAYSKTPEYLPGRKVYISKNKKDLKLEAVYAHGVVLGDIEEKILSKIKNSNLKWSDVDLYFDEINSLIHEAKEIRMTSADKNGRTRFYFLTWLVRNLLDGEILDKKSVKRLESQESFGRLMHGLMLCGANKEQAKHMCIAFFRVNKLKPANDRCADEAYKSYTSSTKIKTIGNYINVEYFNLEKFFNDKEQLPVDYENAKQYSQSIKYYDLLRQKIKLFGQYMADPISK